MNSGFELIVNKDYQKFETNLYLKFYRNNRPVIIGQKDGLLVEQEIESSVAMPISPLLTMKESMANAFIKAIADYASNEGLNTENENLLKGKLEATEKHLEDMRLAFTKLLDKNLSL